jgi:phytoene desaturase
MYIQTNNGQVVVIGAGMAVLAAANLLAKHGCSGAIFEASDKVGGCCATTTLNGYTFNDGAVFLTVIGLIDLAFSRIG